MDYAVKQQSSEVQNAASNLELPSGTVVNNPATSAGDPSSSPGSGRSPGEGNDNPIQYSCLENPMDRGAWQVTRVGHGLATKSP